MKISKKCSSILEANNLIRRLYYEGACTSWKITVEIPYFIVEYETEEEEYKVTKYQQQIISDYLKMDVETTEKLLKYMEGVKNGTKNL